MAGGVECYRRRVSGDHDCVGPTEPGARCLVPGSDRAVPRSPRDGRAPRSRPSGRGFGRALHLVAREAPLADVFIPAGRRRMTRARPRLLPACWLLALPAALTLLACGKPTGSPPPSTGSADSRGGMAWTPRSTTGRTADSAQPAPRLSCLPSPEPTRVPSEGDPVALCRFLFGPLVSGDVDGFLGRVAPGVAVSPALLPETFMDEDRRPAMRKRILSRNGLRRWLGVGPELVVRVEKDCSMCRRPFVGFRIQAAAADVLVTAEGRRIIGIRVESRLGRGATLAHRKDDQARS